jgi:hypothetical protein
MKKIPTLFIRENEAGTKRFLATPEVNPECQWVIDGEGVPTEKFDGTACLVYQGRLWKRQRIKEGNPKPEGWIHWREAQGLPEPSESGHGWMPVGPGNEDRWHREAWDNNFTDDLTYELVGPKVQKDPYGLEQHELWVHGYDRIKIPILAPVTFEDIRSLLGDLQIEGLVWHHPDGRMSKIKRRDFGIPWPPKK